MEEQVIGCECELRKREGREGGSFPYFFSLEIISNFTIFLVEELSFKKLLFLFSNTLNVNVVAS